MKKVRSKDVKIKKIGKKQSPLTENIIKGVVDKEIKTLCNHIRNNWIDDAKKIYETLKINVDDEAKKEIINASHEAMIKNLIMRTPNGFENANKIANFLLEMQIEFPKELSKNVLMFAQKIAAEYAEEVLKLVNYSQIPKEKEELYEWIEKTHIQLKQGKHIKELENLSIGMNELTITIELIDACVDKKF